QRALEDAFLRRFLAGTFPGLLLDEPVLKRRGNLLVLCALLARALPPHKLYFLQGYTETLLGHFYKCPVRLELQTLPARLPYKFL
ncbi:28S ribosomal protein S24, mitochondrial, partial [Geospiza fortis]|uniref:28S ribosomal protein S24, mitochondrial n=3 Tax=Passeriformes TaxID=9126 RepID=A0A6I9HVX9_GEOFO